MNNPLNYKYVARITLEATTPLAVGSGQKGLWVDKVVARDANGLPYIPGTSLTGVLRHALTDWSETDASIHFDVNDLFGQGGDKGTGSRLALSSAYMVGSDGKVVEGLQQLDYTQQGFYSFFDRLPERDHVRITHRGVADAKGHGKFDEQLVHRGTRFVFEIELTGTLKDDAAWQAMLRCLVSPAFRIGSGTRKGFGKLRIVGEKSKYRCFDLTNKTDLLAYLNLSASLNETGEGWQPLIDTAQTNDYPGWANPGWVRYSLQLTPENFFLFDAGAGDVDADNIPKKELSVEWSADGKPFIEQANEQYLIPATSVKGAVSHRTAYHYNWLNKKTQSIQQNLPDADSVPIDLEKAVLGNLQEQYPDLFPANTTDFSTQLQKMTLSSSDPRWKEIMAYLETITLDELPAYGEYKQDMKETLTNNKKNHVGEQNKAVETLFGSANNSEKRSTGQRKEDNQPGSRGNVILDDLYLPAGLVDQKLFNHVRIDRFTQGAADGALYQEKTLYTVETIQLDIWVAESALTDKDIKTAFENTLNDLCEGRLPLGGRTMKGHGIFKGKLTTPDHETNNH